MTRIKQGSKPLTNVLGGYRLNKQRTLGGPEAREKTVKEFGCSASKPLPSHDNAPMKTGDSDYLLGETNHFRWKLIDFDNIGLPLFASNDMFLNGDKKCLLFVASCIHLM